MYTLFDLKSINRGYHCLINHSLPRHPQVQTKFIKMVYTCNVCYKTFHNIGKFNQHKSNMHSSEEEEDSEDELKEESSQETEVDEEGSDSEESNDEEEEEEEEEEKEPYGL